MEKEGRFNFKLLVPPRVNSSQVFADKPQENVDNGSELVSIQLQWPQDDSIINRERGGNINSKQPLNFSRCIGNSYGLLPFIVNVPQRDCTPGQLCSKMFDEVEKIKCWKVKVACDAAQSERKLQENKKTIETQRNAIQDLQFQNESLSVKLEEQLSENEDLRNKHNATRNLCNLLKETFDRAADKMQLFESEREETHHLLMENGVNVQKMIVAFEELRGQAEDDQKAMETVKEGLQKFEELKEKYQQEYTLKENEVATLQAKVVDKEGELEKVQRDLHDTQNQCTLLQEATTKQHEDLNCLKMEQESLLEKLHSAEQCYKQSETSLEAVIAELKQSREEHVLILSSKDLSLQEVHRVKNEQAEKLEQVQIILVELKNSLAFEEQRYKKCEEKLTEKNQELERTHKLLVLYILLRRVKYEELLSKCNEVECEKQSFEQQFESKSSKIETIKEKMKVSEEKIVTLSKEIQALTEENQCLRIEVSTMQSLTQGQCQEIEKLLKKMEDKVGTLAEAWQYEDLQEKVKQAERQLKAAEAKCSSVKNKIGCYRKAGEYQKEVKTLKIQIEKELGRNIQLEKKMTSLNEESRIMKIKLEEKIQKLHEEFQAKSSLADELDNEIKELRLTTAEAVKSKEDAELNCEHKTADVVALMEKHKSQYDLAVKEKDAELDERKKSETEALGSRKSLELEVTNLKAENSQLKQQLLTEKDNFQKELSDVKKELSSFKTDQLSQQRNKLESAVNTNEKGRASKKYVFDFDHTKSFRIRTPPVAEKQDRWGKRPMEVKPKTYSPDPNNILSFETTSATHRSIPSFKSNRFKKSPSSIKPPANSKFAAMKRIRDAGWTATVDTDKKRKKTRDIFA
nr:synaptonemal complex protein 1-like [Nerophis lumbriciformis]